MTAHPLFVLLDFVKRPKIKFVAHSASIRDDEPYGGPFFNIDGVWFEQHISCGGFPDRYLYFPSNQ